MSVLELRIARNLSLQCQGDLSTVPLYLDLGQCGLYVGPEADLLNVVPDYASLSSFGTWERGRGKQMMKDGSCVQHLLKQVET